MIVAVGLEPTHLAVLAPKASASAISPCDENLGRSGFEPLKA